jgi:hypothetical protein
MGPSFRSRIQKKSEHAVEATRLTPPVEIQEGAISSENDGFIFLGIVWG